MQKTILHITAHMGGGVGKVLSGVCSFENQNKSEYKHKIIMLEAPEKLNFIDYCKSNGVECLVLSDFTEIAKQMEQVDIVELEWWQHPKFAEFIANFPTVPVNLVIWSHISGCNYPCLPAKFLSMPDKFIFTSRYSYDNPYWDEVDRQFVKNHCAMINSSGGFEHIYANKKQQHDGFNIGYIGTQSFVKINPSFVDYCNKVSDMLNVKFIMVGDKTNQAGILLEAEKYNIAENFEFVDYVSDVSHEFSRFDVFGYILNPTHFGTTENVLLEAMAASLPVVCLNHCAEQYLIRHNETGLLVNNMDEYAKAIKYLYNHPETRQRLGNNAREFVLKNFSVEKTVQKLHQVYDDVLDTDKKTYNFANVFGKAPYEWFLACLTPDEQEYFSENNVEKIKNCRIILKEENKSSVAHFTRNYPNDSVLQHWHAILRGLK